MFTWLKSLGQRVCTPDELDMIEHYQTRAERMADLWVHSIGLGLAAIGGVIMAVLAGLYSDISAVLATAIYALCLIAMLSASTVYNWTRPCKARPILRRLDESCIFLMIAGSYTPFTTQRFEGTWSIGFTLLVWVLALGGAGIKMFAPRISDVLWSLVYVMFGWVAIFALKPMIETVHPLALGLLVAGGLIYTSGVLVFISQRLKFRRAIWHGFVVAGASVHWCAILIGVVLAPVIGTT